MHPFTKALLGLGALTVGAIALDPHTHRCDACGDRWWHFGALHHGDVPGHTCARCGAEQWARPGERERLAARQAERWARCLHAA